MSDYCSCYNHPPKFFLCFDFGALFLSTKSYIILSSSIHCMFKTYIFIWYLWLFVLTLIWTFTTTSNLLTTPCINAEISSRNCTILEGRPTFPPEIAQSLLVGHPWAWEMNSSRWQPSLDDGNYANHPLSLKTAQSTESRSYPVLGNYTILLGSVHESFPEKKK